MSPRPKGNEAHEGVAREQVAHAVSRVLNGAESLSDVAPHVLELLANTLRYDVATLWLRGGDAQLTCRAVWSSISSDASPSAEVLAFIAATRGMRVPAGSNLPGQTTTAVAMRWIEDLAADGSFTRGSLAAAAGLRSVAAFPIASTGELRGVIELFSRSRRVPDEATLELFALLGTQLALFVERKQAIATLRMSEDRYRRLARTFADSQRLAHVGSFEATLDDGAFLCSEELSRILGRDAHAELSGAEAVALIDSSDREEVLTAAREAIAADRTVDVRFRIVRPDGQQRVVRMRACTASDAGRRRFTGAVLDITDDHVAAAERSAMQVELEEAKRLASLGNLAATMAHEFNNVLMGIETFATFLRRKNKDPDTLTAATHIQQSLKRGRTITDEILRFTRATSPVLHLIDVARWLREFMPEAAAITDGRALLELSGEAMFVRGDPGQLNQVLANLVINARDASPDGEPITIRAASGAADSGLPDVGRCLVLSVCDHGPGIPQNIRHRIFEPLFTTKRKGTGLGLAVVYQVIRSHGGVIRVRSEVGEGTEMRIVMPLVDSAEAAAERHGVARVVLVEEEETIAAGLHDLLAMDGIDATVVIHLAEAIAQIEVAKPDALIIDVGLPHSHSSDLYIAIAARWPKLPTVVMTSHAPRSDIAPHAKQPHVTTLQKPFDGEQLLAALTAVARAR